MAPHAEQSSARDTGHDRTAELAVMCDTFKSLKVTPAGEALEAKEYHYTWVKRENTAMEQSK